MSLSPDTLAFLAELAENNNKAWFDANRARYESVWLGAAKQLVADIAEPLRELIPGLQCQPKVNGSIFRINRDTRFSKDKTPYKAHLDLWFWQGDRKRPPSAMFARLGASTAMIGCGSHGFDKEQLADFRQAVAAPDCALPELASTLGLSLQGEHYKRTPKGLDDSGPGAPWLRHNALYVHEELPADAFVADPIGALMPHFERFVPLHRWLIAHVPGGG